MTALFTSVLDRVTVSVFIDEFASRALSFRRIRGTAPARRSNPAN
jgi:hypothetical protein